MANENEIDMLSYVLMVSLCGLIFFAIFHELHLAITKALKDIHEKEAQVN